MKARLIFLLSIIIVIMSIFFACSSTPKETEKPSSLCYRSAFYVADDGWVYEFDNQYHDGDFDYGSQADNRVPFAFKGINLRYRYNEGFTESFETEDKDGNKITKTVLQSTLHLGNSDSQIERRDMDKIAKYLDYSREGPHLTTADLLALTAEDLDFEYVDTDMFLELMHECLTSEADPYGNYRGIPSWGLFTEPVYLNDYKFQIGLLGGFGRIEVLMFDVLYRTGDGLTDYVQLYDLVQKGEASEEQIRLLSTLQDIEQGVTKNSDHRYRFDELGDEVIANVDLSRLYAMLENILKLNYGQYVVLPQ